MQLDWLKKCGVVPHLIPTSIPIHGFRHTRGILDVELLGLGLSVLIVDRLEKDIWLHATWLAQRTRVQQFWMLNKIRKIRSYLGSAQMRQ